MLLYRLRFLILSTIAGLVAGFVSYSRHDSLSDPAASTAGWVMPKAPEDYTRSADRLILQLQTSGFLPAPLVSEAIPEEVTTASGSGGDIIFLSSAIIDGVLTIQIRPSDGPVRSVRRGDIISGDWNVIDVSPREVTLEKNGERRIISRYSK